MFKSVYYDSHRNKMHLWELDENGKTVYNCYDHEIEYYVKDPSGESEIKDPFGVPVIKKIASSRKALKMLKDAGETLYESDLSEEIKFLHKTYKDTPDKIDYSKYKVANIDIEIQGENEFPTPELAKYPINLITVDDYRNNKITTFGLYEYPGICENSNYIFCESEEILLERFIQFFRREKFSIATGWYTTQFDWPYIINRCKNLEIDFSKLSPIERVTLRSTKTGEWKPEIAGVYILDGLDLYKKFSYQNQPSYNLNYIGMQEVGEGKLDYDGQLNDLWKRDPKLFIDYNIQDCLLVRKIENAKKFVDLAINLGIQTRIPFDKVYSTIAVVEGYMIRYLHRYNLIMNDRAVDLDEEDDGETIEGGYVFTTPGFYNHNISIDATSEYPTLVRMINISPETKVWNPTDTTGMIKAHTPGLWYKREQGIIPKIVTDIFFERKKFKDLAQEHYDKGEMDLYAYYDSQQLVRKILINSIYGAMASRYFHYFDLDNAGEITLGGRTAVQYIADCINKYFSKDFISISKKYYPNSDLKIGDIPEKIVKVIDTDSILGSSILKTSIGNIKIEDLYNMFETNSKETSKDNFIANVENLFSLSISKDFEISYKPITYIKKHKVSKQMFNVKVGNDNVVVTKDHSLVIKRDDKLVSCSPLDIKSGDILITCDLSYKEHEHYEIQDLGVQEEWVYDIEVKDNHNFFANNILVHNSNYICFDELYNKTKSENQTFLDWALEFEKRIFTNFLSRCMDAYASRHFTENLLHFKREKIILKMYVQAKKKYILSIVADEKKIYDKPKTKVTGVEINKSDLCTYSRSKIKKLADLMFEEDVPNRELMETFIRKCYKEFKKQSIEDISTPKGIGNYDKYEIPLEMPFEFITKTPMANKASIIYNYIIKEKHLPYMSVSNGTKIKYVYIKDKNPYNAPVIAYVGNFPKEFSAMFKVDFDTQFEKQYLNVAQRMFDTLGFGEIILRESKLKTLLEEE